LYTSRGYVVTTFNPESVKQPKKSTVNNNSQRGKKPKNENWLFKTGAFGDRGYYKRVVDRINVKPPKSPGL